MKAAAKKAKAAAAAPSLGELSARWARAKVMEDTARREAEALKKELLEAGAKIGYSDEHLVIAETSSIDTESAALLAALEAEGRLEEAQEKKVATKKVRAIAELVPAIAAAVAAATKKSPRFEQAAKR
jgi:hypothetical protein